MRTAFAVGTGPCLLSVSLTMTGSPSPTSNILLVYIYANQTEKPLVPFSFSEIWIMARRS